MSPLSVPTAAGERVVRFLIPAISALVVLLVAVELGWIPPLDHQWGITLWHYLPVGVTYGLAVATLSLCVPRIRATILAVLARIPMSRALGLGVLIALPILLYTLRERLVFGDSRIFYFAMNANPALFFFPDLGATFFLQFGHRVGVATGIGGLELVQGFISVCASLAVYFFWRAARLLTESPGEAVAIVALILGTGIVRGFAGHLEVYSFVLVTAGAYLWACLAYLRGQCSWVAPAIAFAFGLWVHIQFLFLVPSTMLLFVLRDPGRGLGHYFRQWVPVGLVSLLPIVLFFLLLVLAGQTADLEQAWEKLVRWSEVTGGAGSETVWIELFGGSGRGTNYGLFRPGHLKYLANAFFLLCPWMFLVLGAFLVTTRRSFVATEEARFLGSACLMMLIYAAILRPVFGPYDWDLFSLTAVLLSMLAAHLLVGEVQRTPRHHLWVLMIGSALLLAALPLLAIGVSPSRHAGPFSRDFSKPAHGEDFTEAFERQIAPWL